MQLSDGVRSALADSSRQYCPTYLVVVEEEGDGLPPYRGLLEQHLQVFPELHLNQQFDRSQQRYKTAMKFISIYQVR